MSSSRPFALVLSRDQWLRASHQATALDAAEDAVVLDWTDPDPRDAEAPPVGPAGLAFDGHCRLYRSIPEEGRLERSLWAGGKDGVWTKDGRDFFERGGGAGGGATADFSPTGPSPGTLRRPTGIAVDQDDRLYVVEEGARRVRIFDLWSRAHLRAVALSPPGAPGPRPVDVAAHGSGVVVAVQSPAGVFRLSARGMPRPLQQGDWPKLGTPSRIAASPSGRIAVLSDAGTEAARVVLLEAPERSFPTPHASDLEFETDEVLVVARQPGADFWRLDARPRSLWQKLIPHKARGYDGRGLVRLPLAPPRIGFWTERGLRVAVQARVTYRRRGRVVTFELDAGEYQTRWGRLFIDACLPHGTGLQVGFITRDEVEDDEVLFAAAVPPRHAREVLELRGVTPPMPPAAEVDQAPLFDVVEREGGRELPWTPFPEGDPYRTYEVAVNAPPGRYLWVVLSLSGDTRVTPRVRCLRAERPAHDLLRRLPKAYSRDEAAGAFLHRFLSAPEGDLHLLDARATARQVLLHPRAAPTALLPWLAGFVGLMLDDRWPEGARRTFIEEAATLFRFRGTPGSLARMIEIVVGVRPVIVEHFRLRGLRGVTSTSVVGGGFRVGGQLGGPSEVPLPAEGEDVFSAFAHRFTVLVPKVLSEVEQGMLHHLLDVHRPAHTLYELCSVDAGMRVGRGLLLELSTIVGRTGGFDTAQVGASSLGLGTVVGRAVTGTTPGQSRLGHDARVG